MNAFCNFTIALIVSCEKFQIVSFASSYMKNTVAFRAGSRFPVKSMFYCFQISMKYLLFTYPSFVNYRWGEEGRGLFCNF